MIHKLLKRDIVIKKLREYQNKHMDEIMKAMSDCQSRFIRYGDVFTAALFFSEGPISQQDALHRIRASDYIHILDKNLFLIIFKETPIEGGIVASEKLLSIFLQEKNQIIYVAAVECEKGKEGKLLILQLFSILEFAIEHNHSNIVLDSNWLDSVY